jgi:hypothetical protein
VLLRGLLLLLLVLVLVLLPGPAGRLPHLAQLGQARLKMPVMLRALLLLLLLL